MAAPSEVIRPAPIYHGLDARMYRSAADVGSRILEAQSTRLGIKLLPPKETMPQPESLLDKPEPSIIFYGRIGGCMISVLIFPPNAQTGLLVSNRVTDIVPFRTENRPMTLEVDGKKQELFVDRARLYPGQRYRLRTGGNQVATVITRAIIGPPVRSYCEFPDRE